MPSRKKIWPLFRDTYKRWSQSNALLFGAALSFYAVISLPALLVIIIAIAGLFIGKEDVQAQIVDMANEELGSAAAATVESLIKGVSVSSLTNFSTIIGIAVLIWVSTSVFSQLQTALNAIWGVRTQTAGVKKYIKKRVFAFLIVLGLGLVVLVSFLTGAIMSSLERLLLEPLGGPAFLFHMTDLTVSFLVTIIFLAVVYKVLPVVKIAWRVVLPGAVLTSLLYVIGKYLIGFYLSKSNLASAYGAASSLVLLLLWIYYSALIFLFGAVFTKVFSDHRR